MIPKFRAWIKTEKRHLPVSLIDFKDGRVMCEDVTKEGGIFDSERYPVYRYSEIILEQWTGLCDATKWEQLTESEREQWTRAGNMPSEWKGREIYKGDVLQIPDIVPFKVGFKNGCFMEVNISPPKPLYERMNNYPEFGDTVVTGHIHESEAIE